MRIVKSSSDDVFASFASIMNAFDEKRSIKKEAAVPGGVIDDLVDIGRGAARAAPDPSAIRSRSLSEIAGGSGEAAAAASRLSGNLARSADASAVFTSGNADAFIRELQTGMRGLGTDPTEATIRVYIEETIQNSPHLTAAAKANPEGVYRVLAGESFAARAATDVAIVDGARGLTQESRVTAEQVSRSGFPGTPPGTNAISDGTSTITDSNRAIMEQLGYDFTPGARQIFEQGTDGAYRWVPWDNAKHGDYPSHLTGGAFHRVGPAASDAGAVGQRALTDQAGGAGADATRGFSHPVPGRRPQLPTRANAAQTGADMMAQNHRGAQEAMQYYRVTMRDPVLLGEVQEVIVQISRTGEAAGGVKAAADQLTSIRFEFPAGASREEISSILAEQLRPLTDAMETLARNQDSLGRRFDDVQRQVRNLDGNVQDLSRGQMAISDQIGRSSAEQLSEIRRLSSEVEACRAGGCSPAELAEMERRLMAAINEAPTPRAGAGGGGAGAPPRSPSAGGLDEPLDGLNRGKNAAVDEAMEGSQRGLQRAHDDLVDHFMSPAGGRMSREAAEQAARRALQEGAQATGLGAKVRGVLKWSAIGGAAYTAGRWILGLIAAGAVGYGIYRGGEALGFWGDDGDSGAQPGPVNPGPSPWGPNAGGGGYPVLDPDTGQPTTIENLHRDGNWQAINTILNNERPSPGSPLLEAVRRSYGKSYAIPLARPFDGEGQQIWYAFINRMPGARGPIGPDGLYRQDLLDVVHTAVEDPRRGYRVYEHALGNTGPQRNAQIGLNEAFEDTLGHGLYEEGLFGGTGVLSPGQRRTRRLIGGRGLRDNRFSAGRRAEPMSRAERRQRRRTASEERMDEIKKLAEAAHTNPLENQRFNEIKQLAGFVSDSTNNNDNSEFFTKKADKFSKSYYKDAVKGLSDGDEFQKSYYTGLGRLYDKKPKRRKADYDSLYDVSGETGEDLIHSAHPEAIVVAEGRGRGGLVENGLEQKRQTHGVALSAPTGNYRGNYI
tara:strand:- start:1564 stop:4581 length:3018 start_codon:yes stop_codon:yes gene_type:complete